jgi:predicted O-linked N-acetylglucosamine transferase (SPINDLY family)
MSQSPLQTAPLDPHAITLLRQGNACVAAGRYADALPLYDQALKAEPRMGEAWISLGGALVALGRCREAEEACHRGLRLRPAHADGLNNLGAALSGLGHFATARGCFEAALGRRPDFAQALANLGQALLHEGRFDDAIARYEQALACNPNGLQELLGFTHALSRAGQLSRAAEAAANACRLHPESAAAFTRRADLLVRCARFAEAEAPLASVEALQASDLLAGSQRLLSLNHMPGWTPQRIYEAHRVWGQLQTAAAKTGSWPAYDPNHDRTPGRRLRIGYVSPDLRFHPVGRFFLPLIAAHDKTAVHVTCYAEVAQPDAVTGQIAERADSWCASVGMSDQELCARIVADRIDILVDLAGHTAHHRLAMFARKPAPVQVSWLGYINTTGLEAMDYRLSDAVVDPPGQADALSVERLLRLPSGFVCFAPPAQAPAVAPPPVVARGSLTFGVFNRTAKLNLEMARHWAAIVHAVPGSRLAVHTGEFRDAGVRASVTNLLAEAGLAGDRVELLDDRPDYTAYLARFAEIDVLLDPSPYSGVTTTCEALWQGVPVVTLAGDRHAARTGASLLTHAGLAELVADTPAGYVSRAVALAGDPSRLTALRATLRERLRASALCDQRGFARGIEAAFSEIWTCWRRAEPDKVHP